MSPIRDSWKLWCACLIVVGFAWGFIKITGADDYIKAIKQKSQGYSVWRQSGQSAVPVSVSEQIPLNERDEWLEEIKLQAAHKRIAPIDAKVDRVWKAIPGYNGLEVDLPKTIQLAKLSI